VEMAGVQIPKKALENEKPEEEYVDIEEILRPTNRHKRPK
jgi:hypothetical protein